MEKQLKALAAQLRCPEGEDGIKLGHLMNMSNLSVILHGITNLQIQKKDNILELGYGNGELLSYILSLAEDIHYTGLEISPTMHQQAILLNKPYIDAGMANYQIYNGVNLPFIEPQFDKILTVNTLYFWKEPIKLLQNIYQALKLNGYFVITFCHKSFMQNLPFINYGFQLYEVEEVKQLFNQLPLKLVNEAYKKDKSISKTGALVEREFTSLTFEKTE
ncbi:class I SAM-dependent methyltransferase [Zophobihabitans entericus]|uniref:Class I SAM-dependent methyltransferase n=1 Tax=Zophobihabitans entericus TaxID=1635327 RepID=A0A6G9IC35_9GAMM|nr:class I SAM-dependent methyltransferase [Zophobihabitans entericus]QIQ21397.1 class I SAM-dependent methyltransferase [Zophobihabitans entericus]